MKLTSCEQMPRLMLAMGGHGSEPLMIISSPTGCPGSPTSFFESYMTIKEVFMREVTPSEYKGPSSYRRMVYDGRKRVGVRVIISGVFGMVTPVASFKLLNACAARKKIKTSKSKNHTQGVELRVVYRT